MFNNLIDKLDRFYEAIGGRHKDVSECERIVEQTKLEAKLEADMLGAIDRTTDINIKRQLEARMIKGNYEYKDLVP